MKKPPQRTGAASICQLEGERNSVTIVSDLVSRRFHPQERSGIGCAGRAGAAWLVTGPALSACVRPRRVPLLGVEARE